MRNFELFLIQMIHKKRLEHILIKDFIQINYFNQTLH